MGKGSYPNYWRTARQLVRSCVCRDAARQQWQQQQLEVTMLVRVDCWHHSSHCPCRVQLWPNRLCAHVPAKNDAADERAYECVHGHVHVDGHVHARAHVDGHVCVCAYGWLGRLVQTVGQASEWVRDWVWMGWRMRVKVEHGAAIERRHQYWMSNR